MNQNESQSNAITRSYCNYIKDNGFPSENAIPGTLEYLCLSWVKQCRQNSNSLNDSDIKIIRRFRLYRNIFKIDKVALIRKQIDLLQKRLQNMGIGISVDPVASTTNNESSKCTNKNKNKIWAKPYIFQTTVTSEDMIGEAICESRSGEMKEYGVENFCIYPSGSVKYFLRCKKKSAYGYLFCLWGSRKDLVVVLKPEYQELLENKRKVV